MDGETEPLVANTWEVRSSKGSVELRDGPNGPMIAGYGAVFNRDSSDLGFIEQVDPGAFSKTIQEADVRGLGNHDANWLLGRSKAGTLRLRTDNLGLYYEIDVNESDPDGQRALAKVRRGDWDGSSFCFQAVRDEWDWSAEPPQRRLLEVQLIDVGPVTYPAYPDATAAARALTPLAEKMGREPGELVRAMKTGEIRSLVSAMTKGDTMEPTIEVEEREVAENTDAKNSLEEENVETRVGKQFSAANLKRLQEIHDSLSSVASGLRDLMDTALGNDPQDSDVSDSVLDPDDSRGLSLAAAQLELRKRLVALDA